jgi:ABC-2 type transport system permease protein
LIFAILRTAWTSLRRDKVALALSFLLPVSFFSIFAMIFGGHRDSTPKIHLIVVDQDQSLASHELVKALQHDGSIWVSIRPDSKDQPANQRDYTAATAEAAVKAGDAPVALIVPQGFGKNPISLEPNAGSDAAALPIELLSDSSDPISPEMVAGLLQKAAMTAMPSVMAEQGMKITEKNIGTFTPEQRQRMNQDLAYLREHENMPADSESAAEANRQGFNGLIAVKNRPVVGENKNNPMVSYYAAAVGTMFLLFTASGAAGSLLDEAESGALDRVLSSRIDMNLLLAGKLLFNVVLAFSQLAVMFVWAWLIYRVDLPHHVPGFIVMGISTAFAVAALGMLLASICRSRAQLGAVSTLVILTMSALGGSMVPRAFMPEAMQRVGFFTINGWAIEGFTRVFWRDLPVTALGRPVGVLLAAGIVLFLIARRIARRWEYA